MINWKERHRFFHLNTPLTQTLLSSLHRPKLWRTLHRLYKKIQKSWKTSWRVCKTKYQTWKTNLPLRLQIIISNHLCKQSETPCSKAINILLKTARAIKWKRGIQCWSIMHWTKLKEVIRRKSKWKWTWLLWMTQIKMSKTFALAKKVRKKRLRMVAKFKKGVSSQKRVAFIILKPLLAQCKKTKSLES